jgi:activator of HSP90 ATPase
VKIQEAAPMRRKDIEQTVEIDAMPKEVYEVFMDHRKHAQLIGSKAVISREVGGKFSLWDGDIEGINLELVPNKKIVQHWRANDWAPGYYSRVTFELSKVKYGTEIRLTQIGVPDQFYDDVKKGWRDYYWKPMKEMLKK